MNPSWLVTFARSTILVASLLSLFFVFEAQAQGGYLVVVHSSNPQSAISKAEVAKIFLKKVRRWEDGTPVDPVDQVIDSRVHEAFAADVHGKQPGALDAYWRKVIFAGRGAPPLKLSSDSEVLDYVSRRSGAVGYVSRGASLGADVKTLRVMEE